MTAFFTAILFFSSIKAGEWTSLLNSNRIYGIAPSDEGAWCATNGGVHFFSLEDSSFTLSFRNTDGLPHNTSRAIAITQTGELWAGTDLGLALIVPSSGAARRYQGISDTVFSLALSGDTLAVVTKTGIYIIRMMNTPGSFEDDDVFFFTPENSQEYSIRKAAWFMGDLWMATSIGLLRYYLNGDSTQWYAISKGLPSSDVADVCIEESMVALCSKGFARYDADSGFFKTVYAFQDPLPQFTSIAEAGDTFYVSTLGISGTYKSLFRYVESLDTLDTIGFWINASAGTAPHWMRTISCVRTDASGRVWAGASGEFAGDGLVVWDVKKNRVKVVDNPGLNSNYIFHALLDDNQNLWTAHWFAYNERGVTRYHDGHWENFIYRAYTENDTVDFDASTKITAVDSKGRVVFGGWWGGRGVARFDPAAGAWEEHSWGASPVSNRVSWLAVDPLDRIWVSIFYSNQLRVLSDDLEEIAVLDWPYDYVWDLKFDSSTLWAATSAGLISYKPQDFVSDLEHGEFSERLLTNSKVTGIALDGRGGCWGATNEGVFHWTQNSTTRYNQNNLSMMENDIVDVDRDPWGRLYFLMKHKGLLVHDPAGAAYDTSAGLWQIFTTSNSSIMPGFDYTTLSADRTGRVAIGTAGGGVSLFTMPKYTDTTSEKISVYPNPCYASLGLPVRFTPLDDAQSVVIYTLAGERVAEIPSSGFRTIQGVKQAELGVQNLSAGLYIAVVRFAARSERVKFVILK